MGGVCKCKDRSVQTGGVLLHAKPAKLANRPPARRSNCDVTQHPVYKKSSQIIQFQQFQLVLTESFVRFVRFVAAFGHTASGPRTGREGSSHHGDQSNVPGSGHVLVSHPSRANRRIIVPSKCVSDAHVAKQVRRLPGLYLPVLNDVSPSAKRVPMQ